MKTTLLVLTLSSLFSAQAFANKTLKMNSSNDTELSDLMGAPINKRITNSDGSVTIFNPRFAVSDESGNLVDAYIINDHSSSKRYQKLGDGMAQRYKAQFNNALCSHFGLGRFRFLSTTLIQSGPNVGDKIEIGALLDKKANLIEVNNGATKIWNKGIDSYIITAPYFKGCKQALIDAEYKFIPTANQFIECSEFSFAGYVQMGLYERVAQPKTYNAIKFLTCMP